MLSYRMQRYPLWIVVVITAIPLYIFGHWTVKNYPWTSSLELNAELFRIDERFWLRHVEYSPQRGPVYRSLSDDSHFHEFLLDMGQETVSRITSLSPLKSRHPPIVLKDRTLLYRANNDVEATIFDPHNFSTKTIWLPFEHGVVVDRNFFAFTNDNDLLTVDILKGTPQKKTKLLFEHDFNAVDEAPFLLLSLDPSDVLIQILDSLRKTSLVANAAISVFEEYSLSSYYWIESPWFLLSLYEVD